MYCLTRLEQMPAIPVNASDYSILEKPERFHKRILYHIKHAKQRIIMTMLYLQNDEAGREILDALYEAKQEHPNLHVCVYVDFHRAQRGRIGDPNQENNSSYYLKKAQESQNPIAIYGVPVKKRELFGVLHIKGFVFDDTVIYSGASLNDAYLAYNSHYRLDRYHEIHSKELAHTLCSYINEAFHINFAVQDFSQGPVRDAKEIKDEIRQLRRHLSISQYKFKNSKLNSEEIGITPLVGLGTNNNQLNRVIIWGLYAARNELFICTPYFNPPKQVMTAIEDALKRKVKVTLVVGDKKANDFYIPEHEKFNPIGAIPYVYEENLRDFVQKVQDYIDNKLLEVRIWEDEDNSYHLKGIYIDRSLAIITGNNLNPRAWKLDLENGMLIHDPNHHMQEKFRHEQQFILRKTHIIHSKEDIEDFDKYPEQIKSLLNKVRRFKASLIIKQLL